MLTPTGEQVDPANPATPGTNQSIRWAADGTTQIVTDLTRREADNTVTTLGVAIDDWQRGRLLADEGARSNNGTKGNPSLVADVLGDWREELLVRDAESAAIRIHLSTEVTDRKLYTLMHDPQYRAEVARQQTTYNQPSYPGFYLASDTDWSTVPVPDLWAPGSVAATQASLADLVTAGEVSGPIAQQLENALRQADRHAQEGRAKAATAALDRAMDRLDDPKRTDEVSGGARATLTYQVGTLLDMLS